MTIQNTLKTLDELEAKATKGEWVVKKGEGYETNRDDERSMVVMGGDGERLMDEVEYYPKAVSRENMEFIVALRNSYPALRAEIERLQGERHHLMQSIIDMAAEHGYKDFAAHLNKVDRGEDR
jgi:hypothetical protein